MEELRGYYTIEQAALLLRMSVGGVRRLISDKKIATTTLPGTKRPKWITETEIDRHIRERKPRGRQRKPPPAP